MQTDDESYLTDFFASHLWPQHLPLISQHSEKTVTHQHAEPQAPYQGYCIEEICIAGPGINPYVVESWTKQGGIEQDRGSQKCISRH